MTDIITKTHFAVGIIELRPQSFYGRQWIADNVDADLVGVDGTALTEPDEAAQIIGAAILAGLSVDHVPVVGEKTMLMEGRF